MTSDEMESEFDNHYLKHLSQIEIKSRGLRKWRPNNALHWAVILNRTRVRKNIFLIRKYQSGGYIGDISYWFNRLRYDWQQYRYFMGEQEAQRRAYFDAYV